MWSMRRTMVARCSPAETITSPRRARRTSSSVTRRSQPVAQRLLVALQHRDGVLEERLALLRFVHQVRDGARAREDEERRERAQDHGTVRFRRPERQREDGEREAEG